MADETLPNVPEQYKELKDLSPDQIEQIGAIQVSVKRVDQNGRTLRTAILCVTVLVGMGIIAWVVSKTLDKPQWLTALSVLVGSGLPSYVLYRMRGTFKIFIQNHMKEKIEIQVAVDSSRTSSNLNSDGTTDDD